MSLLTSFPEVESFFMKRSFTRLDLEGLLLKIDERYKERSHRAAARSLVRLKLLQYDLAGHQMPKRKAEKIKQTKRPSSGGNVDSRSAFKDQVIKQRAEEYFQYLMDQLRYSNIKSMALMLNLSLPKLLALLMQKGINKSLNDRLTIEEYNSMRDKFSELLRAVQQLDQGAFKFQKRNRPHESLVGHDRSGVYGKILTYGLGKVIYIRKK